jgi:hypothetical protein
MRGGSGRRRRLAASCQAASCQAASCQAASPSKQPARPAAPAQPVNVALGHTGVHQSHIHAPAASALPARSRRARPQPPRRPAAAAPARSRRAGPQPPRRPAAAAPARSRRAGPQPPRRPAATAPARSRSARGRRPARHAAVRRPPFCRTLLVTSNSGAIDWTAGRISVRIIERTGAGCVPPGTASRAGRGEAPRPGHCRPSRAGGGQAPLIGRNCCEQSCDEHGRRGRQQPE